MTAPHETMDEIAVLRADNARLRRLLDEAGAHDGLRHAFRDTVAVLRTVVRRSAESADDVMDYAARLEGRLDAIARTRATLDAFGEVDLHGLISEPLLAHYVREDERATIAGPMVRLRPKAAQVLALAAYELASNAIEHGVLGTGKGRVSVTWRIEPDEVDGGEAAPTLTLTWEERGDAGPAGPARRGFGTMVLEEMLAYDLRARTELTRGPNGLRCTVRLPFTDRIGRLAEGPAATVPDAAGSAEKPR